MLITKVTRTYSRSINSKNYGVPESWIKVEAVYEATIESGDDPVKVSEMLYGQAKAEVVANIEALTTKMKEAANRMSSVAANGPGSTGLGVGTTGPRAL